MKTSISPFSKGFSLIEILVVIAIIGIISAVAVPSITSFIDTTEEAKVARNAQNLASIYSAGLAAGHNFAEGETQVANVVQNIVTGAIVTVSQGNNIFIGVPNMEDGEQAKTLSSLELRGERLILKGL